MRQQLKVNDVAANSSARGQELADGLRQLAKAHTAIGDVRGIGLMQVLELVSDQEAKTPLGKAQMSQVFEAVYAEGVMVRVSGNNIVLSPPLVIDAGHVKRIVAALDTGLRTL